MRGPFQRFYENWNSLTCRVFQLLQGGKKEQMRHFSSYMLYFTTSRAHHLTWCTVLRTSTRCSSTFKLSVVFPILTTCILA